LSYNKDGRKFKKRRGNFFLAKWLEGTISDVTLKELVSEKDFIDYKKIKNGLELLD